jgi:hypothetical protein
MTASRKPGSTKSRQGAFGSIRVAGSSAAKSSPAPTAGTISRPRLRAFASSAIARAVLARDRAPSTQATSRSRRLKAIPMPTIASARSSGTCRRSCWRTTGSASVVLTRASIRPAFAATASPVSAQLPGRNGEGPRLRSSAANRARTTRSMSRISASARRCASCASRTGAWTRESSSPSCARRSAISGASVAPSAGAGPSAWSRASTSATGPAAAASARPPRCAGAERARAATPAPRSASADRPSARRPA